MVRCAAVVAVIAALTAAQPLVASAPQAVASLQLPPSATTAASTWGPIALIVLDRDRAFPTGDWFCPDSDDPNEICLGDSIVEGDGQIVRYLSAPTEGWVRGGLRQRFRFVGGHAVRWVDAVRSVAIVEQTDKGYRWVAWSTAIERGWACFPQAVVDRFQITPTRPFETRGEAINCIMVR